MSWDDYGICVVCGDVVEWADGPTCCSECTPPLSEADERYERAVARNGGEDRELRPGE